MTREEHLKFCTVCLNRKMDMKQGLVCSITGQRAAFEKECPDFARDENAREIVSYDNEQSTVNEVAQKLSPEILEKLKLEQNLVVGILAGLLVGVVGAAIWGAITLITNFQIGYMAIAIGAMVGFAVRFTGKGIDTVFGFWGAGVSLFSVLLGNFLSIIGYLANHAEITYFEALLYFDYAFLPQIMAETFSPIDLVFYGIAAYAGYHYSFRKITEKTLVELQQNE